VADAGGFVLLPCLEIAPVAVEGVAQQRIGQRAEQAAGAERDGTRGRVDIAAVGDVPTLVRDLPASVVPGDTEPKGWPWS